MAFDHVDLRGIPVRERQLFCGEAGQRHVLILPPCHRDRFLAIEFRDNAAMGCGKFIECLPSILALALQDIHVAG